MIEDHFMLGSDSKPPLRPPKVNPRDYQLEAIDAARQEYRAGRRSTAIILPTGSGKTIVFGLIIHRLIEKGGRGLVLAHRNELISQAVQKLELCGVDAQVEKAAQYARTLYDPDAVVATVQTMQGERLDTWPTDYFTLLVTDEAHHSKATSYGNVYRRFCRHALHLGVTATIDRADKEEVIGDVYESIAYELDFWTAVNRGILAKPLFLQISTDPVIDLRNIRKTAGDYNIEELSARIGPMIEVLANAIKQNVEDRKTLVFTCDVASAMGMATALDSLGCRSEWTHGEDKDRKEKLKRFDSGYTQFLSNCNLLTEGFDGKHVGAIALCRPTQSRPLYAQMIGRGTRPDTEDCLIVDFEYLTEQHELVRPSELFDATTMDPEVQSLMEEFVDREKGRMLDMMVIKQKAEEVHKERQILRIQAREREVRYTRRKMFYPDAVMDNLGIPRRGPVCTDPAKRATDKQLNFLERFGVADPDGTMSKRRASQVLDAIKARMNRPPTDPCSATVKQIGWLINLGVDPDFARRMSRVDATAFLETKWGKKSWSPRGAR